MDRCGPASGDRPSSHTSQQATPSARRYHPRHTARDHVRRVQVTSGPVGAPTLCRKAGGRRYQCAVPSARPRRREPKWAGHHRTPHRSDERVPREMVGRHHDLCGRRRHDRIHRRGRRALAASHDHRSGELGRGRGRERPAWDGRLHTWLLLAGRATTRCTGRDAHHRMGDPRGMHQHPRHRKDRGKRRHARAAGGRPRHSVCRQQPEVKERRHSSHTAEAAG